MTWHWTLTQCNKAGPCPHQRKPQHLWKCSRDEEQPPRYAWVIPTISSCTSPSVGKGPEDVELKVRETAAGGSEQSLIRAHLFYIILTCPDSSRGHSFMMQFASTWTVSCGTFQLSQRVYHTSACCIIPNLATKENLDRYTLKEKNLVIGRGMGVGSRGRLQSPIKSNQNTPCPDYRVELPELLFYMHYIELGKKKHS